MSNSLSDIQAIGERIYAKFVASASQYEQVLASAKAVDPAAADATAQLDSLLAQRNALKASFQDLYAEYDAAVADLGFFTSNADVAAYKKDLTSRANAALAAATGPMIDAAIAEKRGAVTAVEKKAADETAASTTPAGTSESGAIPTSTTGLTGSASDDSGSDHGGKTGTPTTTAGAAQAAASGTSPAPVAGAPAATSGKKLPRDFPERMSNPLSKFSSYTYQLSLYMLSPDAYNQYRQDDLGKTLFTSGPDGGPSVGARLIAQSGGANKALKTDVRAPGFELDYYIDNLKIISATNGKATSTASNSYEITFNIIEPYGISFITKLRKASDSLMAGSKLKKVTDVRNPLKQMFVLGIRFQGYDKNGKVMTSADLAAEDTMNVTATGVFERFLDLTATEMHYKIDGKATTYAIKATSTPIIAAHTSKRGRVSNEARIIATTVAEAIGGRVDKDGKPIPGKAGTKGLLDILNENQQELTKPVRVENREGTPAVGLANVYKLRFLDEGDGTSSPIGDSTLIRTLPRDKTRAPPALSKTTSGSNAATAVKASPDLSTYTVTFKNDTPIMQAISEIIKHSSFLENAQKTLTQNDAEANSNSSKEGGEIDVTAGRMLRWYNLSTDVKVLGWDDKQGDWVYEITYVIQPYDTPAVSTTYSNPPTKYYGPHKRYKYWYTGLNSEIIQYEHQLNNNWFNSVLAATGDNSAQGGPADIPTTSNVPNTGIKTGSKPGAMDAQNAYVTSLYDPGGWVLAKVRILGDPDFLTANPPGGVNDVYNQFYHTDRTINANGGQVFMEISFSEGVDYNNTNGTMDLNSSIFITDYPPEAKIEGICYMITKVTSTFANGLFTQDIEANAVPNLPAATKTATDAARPALAPPGRGASSEGTAGEAEAQSALAAQNSATAAASAAQAATTASTQMTVKAPFNAAIDSQLASLAAAAPAITGNNLSAYVAAGSAAGFSPAKDSAAANEVANDDSYTKLENSRQLASADAGREAPPVTG